MLVIVEGIDRVGKTTLCKMLEKEGFTIFKDYGHERLFSEATKEEKMMSTGSSMVSILNLLDAIGESKIDIVIDRFHLTEYVYGVINRGNDKDKAKKILSIIDYKLANMTNHFVMTVVVEPTNLKISSKKHGDDLSEHDAMFSDIIKNSSSRNLITTNFNKLNETLTQIRRLK